MSEDMKTVTTERVEKYLDITKRARAKATSLCEQGSADAQKLAVMMRMADDYACLLYTSPSPRDGLLSRMPSSA